MASSLRILSPSQDELFTYPLVIIRGIAPSVEKFVYISTPSQPPSTAFPVSTDHAFIALSLLTPGSNQIQISRSPDLSNPTTLNLFYQVPPPAPPYVRLIYLLTSDSDGAFQSPSTSPDNFNIASGIARLQTAGLLIQSAAAEMMHAQKLQRRTFRLAPEVLVRRIPLTTAEAHTKTGNQLWLLIAEHFSALPHRDDIVDLVVMSFTRMTPSGVKAHTALGGGTLALFGGGSIFTWPANVWEIPKRFLDFRTFDDSKCFDDSAFRMEWAGRRACAATTMGALLHELGHCFSLPHPCAGASKNGGGIMARGFDWFDRLFVKSDEEEPFWDRGSAMRLRYHRFWQFEGEAEMRRMGLLQISPSASPIPTPGPTPRPQRRISESEDKSLHFERDQYGGVICCSRVGLGHVGYYRNGDNAAHEEFGEEENPQRFRIPNVVELRRKCEATEEDEIVISVIDVEGRIAESAYDKVM